jgi:hypothetical protein
VVICYLCGNSISRRTFKDTLRHANAETDRSAVRRT